MFSDSPFHDDVTVIAAAAAESGADSAALLRNVSRIAADHGVADWEANSSAYYAIGRGLREGGASEASAQKIALEIAGTRSDVLNTLLGGYLMV